MKEIADGGADIDQISRIKCAIGRRQARPYLVRDKQGANGERRRIRSVVLPGNNSWRREWP